MIYCSVGHFLLLIAITCFTLAKLIARYPLSLFSFLRLKKNRAYLLASAWILLGLGFFLQLPQYLNEYDIANIGLCVLSLPVFCYLAYHEYLNYRWNTRYPALNWLSSLTILCLSLYFLFERTILLNLVITQVAQHSKDLLDFFGYQVQLSVDASTSSRSAYHTACIADEYKVGMLASWKSPQAPFISIIAACTSLQSTIVFTSIIFSTTASTSRRLIAFLATVPFIYIINLSRNAAVIYMTYQNIWGKQTFYYTHSLLGKSGSLVALLSFISLLFYILPNARIALLDLMDLPKRKKPTPR